MLLLLGILILFILVFGLGGITYHVLWVLALAALIILIVALVRR